AARRRGPAPPVGALRARDRPRAGPRPRRRLPRGERGAAGLRTGARRLRLGPSGRDRRLHRPLGAVQLRGGCVTVREPLESKLLAANGDVARVARALEEVGDAFPRRVDADPEKVERGLAQLVLTLIELLRQLMERQALRRMEQGTLTDDEIERLGQT